MSAEPEDQWLQNLDTESLALLQLEFEGAPTFYMGSAHREKPKFNKGAAAKKKKVMVRRKAALESQQLLAQLVLKLPSILNDPSKEKPVVSWRIQPTDSMKPRVDPKARVIVLQEMHLLICTKDKKYNNLRKKLNKAGKGAEPMILTTIGSALAAKFGLEIAVVANIVVTLLIMVLKVGKEVFCSFMKQALPAG